MGSVPCYRADGSFAELIEIDPAIFGARVNREALKLVLVAQHANRRRGTHSTRTRAEVAGSGKKPWAQKHTGNARAGSYQSPLWRGGGIVHGPKPRDYHQVVPRKLRRHARDSAVLGRLQDGEVAVIQAFDLPLPKTKAVVAVLRRIDAANHSWLIATDGIDRTLWRAARNLPRVQVLPVAECSVEAWLRPRRVLLTRAAFDALVAEATNRPARRAAQPAASGAARGVEGPAVSDQGPAPGVER